MMAYKSFFSDLLGWGFGVLALAIGVVNMFWGNDPFFGVFIALLALLFLPPVEHWLHQLTGRRLPVWTKWVLAAFILWASLGVGELFDKVDMMRQSF